MISSPPRLESRSKALQQIQVLPEFDYHHAPLNPHALMIKVLLIITVLPRSAWPSHWNMPSTFDSLISVNDATSHIITLT